MATSYKTPGVYVEEIPKFPPSVAEVETAIPAFIGFTAQAKKLLDGDLNEVPTRITSLLEYEQYFGYEPSYVPSGIVLDNNNMPVDESCILLNSKFKLHNSIRLFYDNGGGACYIISVGTYPDPEKEKLTKNVGDTEKTFFADNSKFIEGLTVLEKYDEPTLILFPEAAALGVDQLSALQQAALLQCATLGDRFAIMDIKRTGDSSLSPDMDLFRNNVGMNNLKYGAVYHPYLNTTYNQTFRFRDIYSNILSTDIPPKHIDFKSLLKDTDVDENGVKISDRVTFLEQVITDNNNITNEFKSDVTAMLNESDFDALTTDAAKIDSLWLLLLQLDGMLAINNDADVKTEVISNSSFLASAKSISSTNIISSKILDKLTFLNKTKYNANKGYFKSDVFNFSSYVIPLSDPLSNKGAIDIFYAIKNSFSQIQQTGAGFEDTCENDIIPYIPFYSKILSELNNKVTLLPPSGAIAGIYASVDNDRGVWKAPANVSINSVNGVSEIINDADQENMNVDPTAGKSINAIRSFTGKGILVWGARTLAGNDNEWRYVSVRRFFSFVEESCKKATGWAVFEPNDANTWAKIRGQIDNFLNNLWREGALAGAKPEQAYYVNVGLGLTMTAQDILEGRLIIEIGMAAVRPAEFIILRFSHKLQES